MLAYGLDRRRLSATAPATRSPRGRPSWSILRSELPKYGGLFVQCEDELAAVSMAIGAAYAGHLAVTGSSGPGLSLKMEALGYAIMAELPLIVVNVQRGGPSHRPAHQRRAEPTSCRPSTAATATPRASCSPRKNVEDCFYIAIEACTHRPRVFQRPGHHPHRPGDRHPHRGLRRARSRRASWIEPDARPLRRAPTTSNPTRSTRITRHAPPGSKMTGGQVPDRHRPRARRMGPPVRQPGECTRR